jgi:excinuclease ABC subunit C
MTEVLTRRFNEYLQKQKEGDDTGFGALPDLILLDGGKGHVSAIRPVLEKFGLDVPLFGMVKDDKHRTRAITGDGGEIAILSHRRAFTLVSDIQEEVHRFAITYHRNLRSKRLRYSALDDIPGIGPKRKEQLLKSFHSIQAIRQATLAELERLLPRDAAASVYQHFRTEDE